MNVQKSFLKVLKAISIFMAVFILFTLPLLLVVAPIQWAGNLLGNLFSNDNNEAKYKDYREDLDLFAASHHLSFDYSELMACTMNDEFNNDILECTAQIDDNGEFNNDVDVSLAPAYSVYKNNVNEHKGMLDPTGYLDLWIPTLYAKDIYRNEPILNEDTDEYEDNWIFDYTEDTIYKDACTFKEPESKCRITREGFWTYPYTGPNKSQKDPTERYGYIINEEGSEETLSFLDSVEFGSSEIHALSTGIIINSGTDEDGLFIEQQITHNGLDFYAYYSNLSEAAVPIGYEAEWDEVIGSSDNIHLSTYFMINGSKELFNPMLLIGPNNDYGHGDFEHIDFELNPDIDYSERFAAMYAEAIKHLGKPYVLGTAGPDAFDCSGFLHWVFNKSGVLSVGRMTAQGYYNICNEISASDAQPGDLVFFEHTYDCGEVITHCGIYLGNGMMIHAGGQLINDKVYSSVHISNVWTSYKAHYARLP